VCHSWAGKSLQVGTKAFKGEIAVQKMAVIVAQLDLLFWFCELHGCLLLGLPELWLEQQLGIPLTDYVLLNLQSPISKAEIQEQLSECKIHGAGRVYKTLAILLCVFASAN
jgi:hypothetical protein